MPVNSLPAWPMPLGEVMRRERLKPRARGTEVALPGSAGPIADVYMPKSFPPANRRRPPRTIGPRCWDVFSSDGEPLYTVRGSNEDQVLDLVRACEGDPHSFYLRERK